MEEREGHGRNGFDQNQTGRAFLSLVISRVAVTARSGCAIGEPGKGKRQPLLPGGSELGLLVWSATHQRPCRSRGRLDK